MHDVRNTTTELGQSKLLPGRPGRIQPDYITGLYGAMIEIMTTYRPVSCPCKIVNGRIVFCALHKRAEKLLDVIEHLRQFLTSVKLTEEKDNNRLQRVILPYVNDQIQRARKESVQDLLVK